MSLIRTTLNAILLTTSVSKLPTAVAVGQTRCVKRWVAPTLRELRKRNEKLGEQAPQPRSGFIEWNYRAELFAFGKRLKEEFQLPLLQTAFTQRSYIDKEQQRQRELGIEESELQMTDNKALAERGAYLAQAYVQAYLKHSFPKVPAEGQQAFYDYLLSTNMLAYIGAHLGMKELLLAAEYPPSEDSLSRSLLAVIGALEQSSGVERASIFVRDFVCTQLNQQDLLELWHIEEPEALLKQICSERKMSEPEPRLIGDSAKNTVLAAYHVGIYVDKKQIGTGFGEDISTAIKTASLDALQKIFGIEEHMRPLNFKLQLDNKSIQQKVKLPDVAH